MDKKHGFTLSEIIITVTTISIIATVIVVTFYKTGNIDVRKLAINSQKFYSGAESAFNEINLKELSLKGITSIESEEKSKKLMVYFNKYLDGYNILDSKGNPGDCSSFVINEEYRDSYIKQDEFEEIEVEESGQIIKKTVLKNQGLKCSKFPSDIIAGFFVDKNCTQNIMVKEFDSKKDPRLVQNACGFIIYELKGSSGTLGKDLFVIGLGKKNLK